MFTLMHELKGMISEKLFGDHICTAKFVPKSCCKETTASRANHDIAVSKMKDQEPLCRKEGSNHLLTRLSNSEYFELYEAAIGAPTLC